jgi:ABC-type phosphate/phosphonate transport system permease subunit
MSEVEIMYSVVLGLLFWAAYNLGKVSATLAIMREARDEE